MGLEVLIFVERMYEWMSDRANAEMYHVLVRGTGREFGVTTSDM